MNNKPNWPNSPTMQAKLEAAKNYLGTKYCLSKQSTFVYKRS